MDRKTIFKYVLYCFVLWLGTTISIGILKFTIKSNYDVPTWTVDIAFWIILIAVFAHMVKENHAKSYANVLVVAIWLWLVFLPVEVLVLKMPFSQWLNSFAEIFLTSLIGTIIGKFLIQRKENIHSTG